MNVDPARFVLVGTSHAGNVGAAARAIKVMGFAELVLVAPRFADVKERPEAIAFASGATDVLERARVVATLGDALDGITWACATAMTPRDFGPPNLGAAHALRRPGAARASRRLRVRLGTLRFVERRCLWLSCLRDDSGRSRLRLAQPGAGGAAHRLRLAPGARRLRCRRAGRGTASGRRRGRARHRSSTGAARSKRSAFSIRPRRRSSWRGCIAWPTGPS